MLVMFRSTGSRVPQFNQFIRDTEQDSSVSCPGAAPATEDFPVSVGMGERQEVELLVVVPVVSFIPKIGTGGNEHQ